MKKNIAFLVATILYISSVAQTFEGKIIYQNSYKSKIANVSDEQLTTMMGSTQEYFIKGGDYKSVVNGSLFQWLLYINKDNKLYSKVSNSESIYWNDGAANTDEVLKAEINKGAAVILGYKCDELILTCKSGIQKYYYNSGVQVDPKLFVNHKFGNWYDFVSRSKSLPLKTIIENGQFRLESIATDIKEAKLNETQFRLPANVEIVKSPS